MMRIPLIVRYRCVRSDQSVNIHDGFLRRCHLKLMSRFLLSRIGYRNRLVLHLINIMRRVVLLIYLSCYWRSSLSRLIACYLIGYLPRQEVVHR
jgi:hypothetical protein